MRIRTLRSCALLSRLVLIIIKWTSRKVTDTKDFLFLSLKFSIVVGNQELLSAVIVINFNQILEWIHGIHFDRFAAGACQMRKFHDDKAVASSLIE